MADARSPTAQNWIRHFVGRHELHVISSYPANPIPGTETTVIPFAFAWLKKRPASVGSSNPSGPKKSMARILARQKRLAAKAQRWFAPLELPWHDDKIRHHIEDLRPDLVHALRIPYEGIMAARTVREDIPLLISVWGNDFTLHANSYWLTSRATRRAMQRADALLTDCQRDIGLAQQWGFDIRKPHAVWPGAGGVKTDLFYPDEPSSELRARYQIPTDAPVVINPRGIRQYVRNDSFFRAIPLVLSHKPETIFVALSMQNHMLAEEWARRTGKRDNIRLLPPVSHHQMPDLFRLAQVMVSPSVHDGTPNTLLEAMACGCLPIVGAVESVYEWIVDGENGLVCDPTNPQALAAAILRALTDDDLRRRAQQQNIVLVRTRADYYRVMPQAESFYEALVRNTS